MLNYAKYQKTANVHMDMLVSSIKVPIDQGRWHGCDPPKELSGGQRAAEGGTRTADQSQQILTTRV